MQPVTRETVVELHELCLDICPFSLSDRHAVCPECPVYAYAAEKQWRIAFSDALKLIKDWAGFCGKRIA